MSLKTVDSGETRKVVLTARDGTTMVELQQAVMDLAVLEALSYWRFLKVEYNIVEKSATVYMVRSNEMLQQQHRGVYYTEAHTFLEEEEE